ncbi:hypothetical protein FALB51S_02495 [Frigidibacter albus]
MLVTDDFLAAAMLHARVDASEDTANVLLILAAAAADVAGAANYTLPATSGDLPDDLGFAVIDQALMIYDARGSDTKRPVGLSLAASRIVARYRGVRVCRPIPE